jgi:hypothetical protein
MSKKNVVVNKKQLTQTGEDLEVVGTVAEVAGAIEVAEGLDDLATAQTAVQIGVAKVASASSNLTRAADAALVAERMQDLSEIVAAAGVVDVEEGVEMMMKGGDVKAMSAIVGLMSEEELERGLALARVAGELSTVGDMMDVLQMPVLAEFLADRGQQLQDIAVDQLLRFTSTRALAGAIKEAGEHIEAMGEDEVVEGMMRGAVSEAAAARSAELSAASDALAGKAVDELATAAIAREVARDAVASGVTEIAEGSAAMGAGAATKAMGEALEERAS